MKEQLKSIDERAKEELSHIDDAKLLEDFRVRFLGKKGEITSILKQMGKLSAEERPVIGQLANKVIAAENAVMKAGKIIAKDTTEGLVKRIEGKVWQGNIPTETLSRWEHRLRVVNLRNEPDGTVTLRYLADAPQLPDSVPAQPRLEDLWLFPEEMEEAK